jgi:hypothetical protein
MALSRLVWWWRSAVEDAERKAKAAQQATRRR